MNKPQLIRLIHVAKTQLGMDDETYRAKLDALTGKTSCSQMSLDQLNAVYQSFKDAGFKRQFKKKGGARVTPNAKGQSKAPEIPKIRAIWCVMAEQGFVKSASETSLNGFVKRMTASLNNGAGVAEVGWLNSRLACQVLETLRVASKGNEEGVKGASYSFTSGQVRQNAGVLRPGILAVCAHHPA